MASVASSYEKVNPDYTGRGTYHDAGISAADQAKIDDIKRQWNAAAAQGDRSTMDSLHSQAEAIRAGYGYSGGGDGSEYIQVEKPQQTQQQQTVTPQVNDYSAYIEEMNRAAREKALAELRSSYEQNVAGVDRARQDIAPSFESARNQAAAQNELQRRQFAEYAAANGLNSGVGGQAQLAQSAALQQGLTEINTAESSAMADLELQRSQMEIEYNNAITQANATGNYELAQQLYAEKVRQDEALLEQIQWQAQQELANQQLQMQQQQTGTSNDQWNQQFQQQQSQQDWSNMLDIAKQMAAYGDFSGYEALGYDTTTMRNQWQAQQRAAQTAASSSSASASKPTLTFSEMERAMTSGQITAGVKEAYEYYMREPWPEDGTTQATDTLEIDQNSVAALGRGPLSGEQLAELEAAGEIQRYTEGGRIKFRNVTQPTGSSGLFGSGGYASMLG